MVGCVGVKTSKVNSKENQNDSKRKSQEVALMVFDQIRWIVLRRENRRLRNLRQRSVRK